MIERSPGLQGILVGIRRAVFHMRSETPQEREHGLNSLSNQMHEEEWGSRRYDLITTAHRWLKGLPDRYRPVVFGQDMPWYW